MTLPKDFRKRMREGSWIGKKWGLVTVNRGEDETAGFGMGNGLLNTGLYYSLLADHALEPDENFAKDKSDLFHTFAACQAAPGVFWRGPEKKDDPQSHDDYFGIVCAAYLYGLTDVSSWIVSHGQAYDWVYNAQFPTQGWPIWRSHDRFPGQTIYYTMAVEKVSFWAALPLWFRILWMILKPSGDGWVHSYLMLNVARREMPLMFSWLWSLWLIVAPEFPFRAFFWSDGSDKSNPMGEVTFK